VQTAGAVIRPPAVLRRRANAFSGSMDAPGASSAHRLGRGKRCAAEPRCAKLIHKRDYHPTSRARARRRRSAYRPPASVLNRRQTVPRCSPSRPSMRSGSSNTSPKSPWDQAAARGSLGRRGHRPFHAAPYRAAEGFLRAAATVFSKARTDFFFSPFAHHREWFPRRSTRRKFSAGFCADGRSSPSSLRRPGTMNQP